MASATHQPADFVYGAAAFGRVEGNPQAKFKTSEAAAPILNLLQKEGLTHFDTARAYPPGTPGYAEKFLGEEGVNSWATIDTKVTSGGPNGSIKGPHSAENIAKSVAESLEALKVNKVNTMYLHVPDRSTPYAETLRAIDKEYRAGKFEKFGLSNYRADEVEEFVRIAETEGLIKPSVYQGHYNAVRRGAEFGEEGEQATLFSVLRKHGIAYYAYSPTAAGLFSAKVSKGSEDNERDDSRWNTSHGIGTLYQSMYFKPSVLEAVDKVKKVAAELGIDGHAVALRWTTYHSILDGSRGDKVIIGASSLEQLESNIASFKAGPLPASLAKLINDVWPSLASENSKYYM